MTLTPQPSAAERFPLIIEGLCRAVAARGAGRMPLAAPLIVLIWGRLRRMAVRFAALAARVRAGTLPSVARVRRSAASSTVSRAAPPPAGLRLPEGFAWLFRLVPEAPCFGSLLQILLADPEMKALLSAAPQMGRLLRPLCRMLGVDPCLLPPPPPRRRRSSIGADAPVAMTSPCATAVRATSDGTTPDRSPSAGAVVDPPHRPRRRVARDRPPAAFAPALGPPVPG